MLDKSVAAVEVVVVAAGLEPLAAAVGHLLFSLFDLHACPVLVGFAD